MDTKRCPKCDAEKPLSEFYENKTRADGLSPWCVLCQRKAGRRTSMALRAELLALLGGICCRCGFPDPRALEVDHVKGGGNAERATGVMSSQRRFVEKVRLAPRDYQLLCANCNRIKKHEAKETGRRVYQRVRPSKRLQGIGKGNAPGSQGNLNTSSERQKARARAYWDSLTPEQREERRRKQSAATTGRKLVDGHWVRPD